MCCGIKSCIHICNHPRTVPANLSCEGEAAQLVFVYASDHTLKGMRACFKHCSCRGTNVKGACYFHCQLWAVAKDLNCSVKIQTSSNCYAAISGSSNICACTSQRRVVHVAYRCRWNLCMFSLVSGTWNYIFAMPKPAVQASGQYCFYILFKNA